MTETQIALWNRIQAFQLDDAEAAFTFSHRLAAENGWSRPYTLRVIEEYKRFLFLCCTSKTPVTPSDAVDQAWHLHLVYTRSYWNELCGQVLQRELHHGPTKGGKAEAEKFDGMYTLLKELYKEAFSEEPPGDIWLDNEERFKRARFQRINRNDYWMWRKPVIEKRSIVQAVFGLILIGLFVKANDIFAFVVFIGIVILIILAEKARGKRNNDGSGCGGGSCGGDIGSGHGSHGSHGSDGGHGCSSHGCSSGCNSGCSGCGGGGCGGCGGGD
ncbi:hypothetical protein SAMN05421788_104196 [Filimonas lacunae]|uniref:TIGR04222 domain-containing protein n=1 Tax=Filimonas lacunae TaxID=477680 RepID=A0A173M946_9BACT|nr:hypothetical protein [Filimonas lacunae]BAV04067.1 hypothetical protein FLA_0046 [Filimonas lacunae]SIT15798.1 hypothetical protein SAMN05421788_104196 [Filimonas lacunae]